MDSEYDKFKKEGITAERKEDSMKVYLAGPIHNLEDEQCKDWRKYAKEKLHCETLDPMDRDFRGLEKIAEKMIVEGDKLDIMNATIVLVNYEHKNLSSIGTAMEILFAWEQHKPVVIVTKDENPSPWLGYHSYAIFKELDDAIDYINTLRPLVDSEYVS